MSPRTKVPEPHAVVPLTLLDVRSADMAVNFAWLVQGRLDTEAIQFAISRVVKKWPLLGGRVEYSTKNYPHPLQVRVPLSADLNPFDESYKTFEFTEKTSSVPITKYVQLPIPTIYPSLPDNLTRHHRTPNRTQDWVLKSLPLIWWHVTHFPRVFAGPEVSDDYTIIGISFPHGVFDGAGGALVVHALEAEIAGREWKVPPSLREGTNENILLREIEAKTQAMQPEEKSKLASYGYFMPSGAGEIARYIAGSVWKKHRQGSADKTLVLTSRMVSRLVDRVKRDLQGEGLNIQVTTGDVLVAWIYKTIYSGESAGSKSTFLSNLRSTRTGLAPNGDLDSYLHNCFLTIPYPTFSISELQALPLHKLVSTLAAIREAPAPNEVLHAVAFLEDSFTRVKPLAHWSIPPHADDYFTMSNKVIFKIGEVDWTAVGGKGTILSHQCVFSPVNVLNMGGMNGWIKGGPGAEPRLAIQMVLTRERWAKVEAEVAKLDGEKS